MTWSRIELGAEVEAVRSGTWCRVPECTMPADGGVCEAHAGRRVMTPGSQNT